MNARNKRLKRALKYMAIFTIAPHFILLAVNVAANVFYGCNRRYIFALYSPQSDILLHSIVHRFSGVLHYEIERGK